MSFYLSFFIYDAKAIKPAPKSEFLGSKILTVKDWLATMRTKGHKLFYVHSQLDMNRLIRLNQEGGNTTDLLKDILRGQPVNIIEKGEDIYIVRKKIVTPDPDIALEAKILKGKQSVYLYNSNIKF